MAFGLSKNDTKSEMIGADVVVAYFDETTGKLISSNDLPIHT